MGAFFPSSDLVPGCPPGAALRGHCRVRGPFVASLPAVKRQLFFSLTSEKIMQKEGRNSTTRYQAQGRSEEKPSPHRPDPKAVSEPRRGAASAQAVELEVF